MTTLLVIFSISLLISLIITPYIAKLGIIFGAMDEPNERKHHKNPIPRIGGLSILSSFVLTLCITSFFKTDISNELIFDKSLTFFFIGAGITFGIGLFDDFHQLRAIIKLLFQILGASIAFYGGLKIEFFKLGNIYFHTGILSYFVTVFWFVFFINAINLIDGLDGLAAGIVFFACLVLVLLSVLRHEYLIALLFAALGGSVLGFLRYNFNPASIFMGDGGSYFLGYAIAGLSIMGKAKSQLGAAMLIPLIALGVPVFDTMIAPLRRFILGKAMFKPDKEHFHHKLIEKGLSAKNAVLYIYRISIALCILAIVLVNVRNEQAGLFLIIIGGGTFFFIKKIGYFEYFATDKLYGWFKDMTDEAGFTKDRRTFLNLQVEISKSETLEELWKNICHALNKLDFDMAELHLNDNTSKVFVWTRDDFNENTDILKKSNFKMELPLFEKKEKNFGMLWLVKDINRSSIGHYTLRRVEHLRRTVIRKLVSS